MRKLGEGAWIGFVFVSSSKRNFHQSKLFGTSSVSWMVSGWANKYVCAWKRNTLNSCWGAAPQIEHRIAGWEKTTKLSNFWQFYEQFSPQTSNLYIKNTYFAKKIDSDTTSWPVGGLKHFGQSQGGLPPPTQLTNTKIQMSQTSRLSRAINYHSSLLGSIFSLMCC